MINIVYLCVEEKLDITSYNNPNELLNQRSKIIFVGIKKLDYLVKYIFFLFLSGSYLTNKILFVPTFFSQNYPDDLVLVKLR